MLRGLFKRAEIRRLGRYAVIGELGRGGMGTVLEAYDDELDRRVALKLLHSSYKERQGKRLRREAQALARLSHPNVVQVFEVGEIDGQPFVALELVEGQTLEQWQSQRKRPGWRQCVEVYLGAGRGLAAAHSAGLVHRDFKPRNCIVGADGRARLLDFGLVVREESATTEELRIEGMAVEPRDDALGSSLTKTGAMMGTPPYMPLEQLEGRTTDASSDQFSFCVSLYEAIHGERPYSGDTVQALAASLALGAVRPVPKGRRVPRELRRILLRGLAPTPTQRWPSMNALLDALERVAAPRIGRRRAFGITALGAGLAASLNWPPTDPCATASIQLDGVWDEARRDEVRTAVAGSGHRLAEDTWDLVQARLDEHAEQWAAGFRDVCEATRHREPSPSMAADLRMQCLERHRVELRQTVDVLARPDTLPVERAAELVSGLSPLSRCELEALQTQLAPPSPEKAEPVEAVRHRLAEVAVQRHAGMLDGALPNADAIVDDAEALGYGPLLAEALHARAEVRDNLGDYAQAKTDLLRAHRLALSHDHWQAATQTASALLWVVGHHQGNHAEARRWGESALALAERRETADWLEAEVTVNLGIILREQGRLDEALGHLRRALATQKIALGTRHPTVASTHLELGNILLGQGKLDDARVHYEQALSIQSEVLGPWHPKLAGTRSNIGTMLMTHGQLDAASEHYLATLAIQTEVLGLDHPDTAMTLGNLGHLRQQQGRLPAALRYHRQALAIQEGRLGADHPDLARTRGNIAVVLHLRGELDEALTYYRRALAGFEASLGPQHPIVAHTLDNIGGVLQRQGKLEQASRHHERTVAFFETKLGPEHPSVANALSNLGLLQLERGQLLDATDSLQRSLSILDGSEHPDMIPPLAGLARIALMQGDRAAAQAHAERAISIGKSTEVDLPYPMAEARFVLAQILWLDPSRRSHARYLAEQAQDGFDDTAENEHQELQRWLDDHALVPRLPS